MHFDPNTGEKIMDPGDEVQVSAENQAQGANQFQQAPQFQQIPADTNKVKKGAPVGLIIGIIAAVLVIIAGVAVFALYGGLGAKVSLVNTITTAFDGEYLTDATKDLGYKPFTDMTVKAEMEMDDIEVVYTLSSEAASHTRSLYSEITYDGFTIDINAYVDEKQVLATCPILGDYLFTYDYSTDDHDGLLEDILDSEDIDFADLNAMIAFVNDNNGSVQKFYEDSVAYAIECLATLDFKKTGNKETFTVNGNKIECKEYAVVITEDTVTEWINGYQEIVEKFVDANSDAVDAFENYSGEEFDIDDIFDEALDEVDGSEDVTLSIFTKGKITAAIRITNEDGDEYFELQLKGGDYLAQNMEVIHNDDGDEETILTVSGKTKGDVQTTTIEDEEGYFEFEYSFNRKTGEFEMTLEEYGREVYAIEATLTFDKDSYTMDFDTLSVYGNDLGFDKYVITVSNKAEITKPKGDEFDLGDADEDDFEELVEDFADELEDNDELQDLLEELGLGYLFYGLYY